MVKSVVVRKIPLAPIAGAKLIPYWQQSFQKLLLVNYASWGFFLRSQTR